VSAETSCPQCQRALPSSVVSGPAQAVVRCEGCTALLLWSNGRVVRAAKPGTGGGASKTVTGMPAVIVPPKAMPAAAPPAAKPPAAAPPAAAAPPVKLQPLSSGPSGLDEDDDEEDVTRIDGVKAGEPLPALKPEADEPKAPALARIETKKEPARTMLGIPSVAPGPLLTPTAPAPAAPKKEPSAPIAVGKAPSSKIELGKAPAVPSKRDPSAPIAVKKDPSAPIAVKKDAPSGRVDVKAPMPKKDSAPIATGAPKPAAAKDPSKPHVVAAVAEVKVDASGPMVNPTEWFHEQPSTGKGQTLPPVVSTRKERPDPSGPVALPPPPGVDTGPAALPPLPSMFSSGDKTPPLGTQLPEAKPTGAPAAAAPPVAATPPAAAAPVGSPLGARPSTMMGVSTEAPRDPAARKTSFFGTPATMKEPAKVAPAAPKPVGAVKPPSKEEEEQVETLETDALDELPPLDAPMHSPIKAPPPAPAPSVSPPPSAASPPGDIFAPLPAAPTIAAEAPAPAPLPSAPTMTAEAPAPPAAAAFQPVTLEPTGRSTLPGGNKKMMIFIAAGVGGFLLVGGLIFALTRGGSPAPEVKKPEPVATKPPEPTPPPEPVAKPPEPTPPKEPAAKPPEPTEPVAAANPETPPEPRRRGKMLGGKNVVLEYDPKPTAPEPPPATAPVPQGEDPGTVARARDAYHRGNQKLFSGDTEGALALYRESLRIYPGYVAGYRGLGLAFAEQGNVPDAMTAFKKYVTTVPNARDVPLIKKRMEKLTGKPAGP
jgi:hypothetical protein